MANSFSTGKASCLAAPILLLTPFHFPSGLFGMIVSGEVFIELWQAGIDEGVLKTPVNVPELFTKTAG